MLAIFAILWRTLCLVMSPILIVTWWLQALLEHLYLWFTRSSLAAVRDYAIQVQDRQGQCLMVSWWLDTAYWNSVQYETPLWLTWSVNGMTVPHQAEQPILNMVFRNNWLPSFVFDNNYVVTKSSLAGFHLPNGQDYPVLHYASHRKPCCLLACQAYREVWWFYAQMDWSGVAENAALLPLSEEAIYPKGQPFTCLATPKHFFGNSAFDGFISLFLRYSLKLPPASMWQINWPNWLPIQMQTVYLAIAGLPGQDLELVRTSDLLLDINPGRKVVEIFWVFSLKINHLGFEDLKSTKHKLTNLPYRWKRWLRPFAKCVRRACNFCLAK